MSQGKKVKFSKKPPKQQKRKNLPVEQKDRERIETVRTYKKEIQKGRKKIYRSIEKTIIEKAKGRRENFEII